MIIKEQQRFQTHHYSQTVKDFLNHFQLNEIYPNFDFLKKILHYFSKIPYENVSKIIKFNQVQGEWDRLRMPWEVWNGFLENNLGGTCFSLTFFLWAVLEDCGFEVRPVVMDMKWAEAAHCALILLYEEVEYLVDPGYLFSHPIELQKQSKSYSTDNFTGIELRYDQLTETYFLSTYNKQEKKFRYKFVTDFMDQEQFLILWKDSFYRQSMRHICLTKVDLINKGRIFIRNNFVRYYSPSEKQNIKIGLEAAAAEFFNIQSDIIENARTLLNGKN